MTADPKQELRALIDQLSQTDAQETLAYAQRQRHIHTSPALQESRRGGQTHALPVLHRAPAIVTIDDLQVPLFSTDDSAQEFDATLRRWREMPESA